MAQLDPAQAVDVAQQYRDEQWGNLDAEYAGIQRADLRIGVNRRFPANLAESEFGVPGGGQA